MQKLYSRDGAIMVWSCGKNRAIEPALKVDETLTCCDIFDGGANSEAGGDVEMQQEQDGELSSHINR